MPDRRYGLYQPELIGFCSESGDGGERDCSAWVFDFRPNWPVKPHGSGSPPSQELSATGPDQIHGRTAPERRHESGDPHRLSR
ncbi:hypothetical protein M0R45_033249 [Rubus argutus]|uniref:Uncharacterized protein n=1 Tax=Rubus argutus TaxID=59490 RepID=A0AAW1WK07_RUBAR